LSSGSEWSYSLHILGSIPGTTEYEGLDIFDPATRDGMRWDVEVAGCVYRIDFSWLVVVSGGDPWVPLLR
jgi:hypothetical protein